ncbi:MAG TPA: PE-PPE domain-containing protein [Mycobacterium sp.]|nr:PE-PPE domain-containing protein [Mycobacterium sp.]
MRFRPDVSAGVAIVGVGLIVTPQGALPAPGGQARAVQLTSSEIPGLSLGDGTAFVIGGSGVPVPPPQYVQALESLYLTPNGFTGDAQPLDTPEGLYPITGIKSLELDPSVAQGAQILEQAVEHQLATGDVSPANPVVVVGLSQSSTVASQAMPELAQYLQSHDLPSDDLHFFLLSDPSNPDGGLLERFDGLSLPSVGVTFSGATPDDLFPTDVYTPEYDGFSDFPKYPIDLLSDLNAFLGIIYQHHATLTDTAQQVANAVPVATSAADTMSDYYVLPTNTLPLLEPLQAIPVIGKPLVDLIQPDLSILINLGYGQIGGVDPTTGLITGGWDPGPANVPTPLQLFPTNLNWGDVFTALGKGWQQGTQAAIQEFQNPANYQLPTVQDALGSEVQTAYLQGMVSSPNPSLLEVLQGVMADGGFPISHATLTSSPTDIINDLTGTASFDYSTALPFADGVVALLVSLPSYDASLFVDQLEAGNLLGAIGDPIAADIGMIPGIAGLFMGEPLAIGAGGTLINLIDLFS